MTSDKRVIGTADSTTWVRMVMVIAN